MWSTAETKSRSRAIKAATPQILSELYDEQAGICDLCGEFIDDVLLATVEHSVPKIWFARSELLLDEAIKQANARSNLKAAHFSCNAAKSGLTREEWYKLGLNHREKPQHPTMVEHKAHCAAHRAACSRPEFRQKISISAKIALARPAVKHKMSKAARASRRCPEVITKWLASVRVAWDRPGAREKSSEIQRKRWACPEIKAKYSASQRAASTRPEVKERRSAGLRAAAARPEVKARHSAGLRAYWVRRKQAVAQTP